MSTFGGYRDVGHPMDWESDTESDGTSDSVVSMNVASQSSATSYEVDSSMRSDSPHSVLTVDSSMEFYQDDHGRLVNTQCDIYRLPADQEELERLGRQHDVLARLMGFKYINGLDTVLANTPGEQKTCLDLGCGAGSWIIDVCRDFPHIEAVGVDLIPMQEDLMPPNLRSEVDDINLGLEHFFDSFTVVHTRLISAGISNYDRLVDQIAHIVEPGGLVDLSEYDFRAYDLSGKVIPVDESSYSPPWWARWLVHLRAAVRERGGDVDAATNLHNTVCNHPRFKEVRYKDHFLPVVPLPSAGLAQCWVDLENGLKENIFSFLHAGRPLLFGHGLSEEYLFDLEAKVRQEVEERRFYQFCRLQCVSARRKTPDEE